MWYMYVFDRDIAFMYIITHVCMSENFYFTVVYI